MLSKISQKIYPLQRILRRFKSTLSLPIGQRTKSSDYKSSLNVQKVGQTASFSNRELLNPVASQFDYFMESQEIVPSKLSIRFPESIDHVQLLNYHFVDSKNKYKSVQKLATLLDLDSESKTFLEFILKKMKKNSTSELTENETKIICQLFHSKLIENGEFEATRRTPVITVMGHVDHGKTTFLDYLKKTQVAEAEEGGITQRIGGFMMEIGEHPVTFIDTPGHAIFSNMRKTGAMATDIVILIVSAIEGVQQQTREIIELIHEFNLPVYVAINKIDSPMADPDGVCEQLIEAGMQLEEDVENNGNIFAGMVSAKTGEDVLEFCEMILEDCQSLGIEAFELIEAECVVIESRAQVDTLSSTAILEDKSKNATQADLNICSVVVKNGILRAGSNVIFGDNLKSSKVTKIKNEKGHLLKKAEPGEIVELVGLDRLPEAGDILSVMDETLLKRVKSIRQDYNHHQERLNLEVSNFSSVKLKRFKNRRERRKFYGDSNNIVKIHSEKLEELKQKLFTETDETKKQELNLQYKEIETIIKDLKNQQKYINPVIIKVNEHGKLKAIQNQLDILFGDNAGFTIQNLEVGTVTQKDVEVAIELGASVLLVDVQLLGSVDMGLEENKVVVKNYQMIHELINHLEILHQDGIEKRRNQKKEAREMNTADLKLEGRLEVKRTFRTKAGKAAGITVFEGRASKDAVFRVLRNDTLLAENLTVKALKHFTNDVSVLKSEEDGGISFNEFEQFKAGDVIECFNYIN